MWPAKLPGEGAELFYACKAMCEVMKQLGIAIDGGKDSLSMAAKVGEENIKAPGKKFILFNIIEYYCKLIINCLIGSIVISTYVPCEDVRLVITPDLKGPRQSHKNEEASCLLFVDLSGGQRRLGASALAQCYGQLGNNAPDLDDPSMLKKAFKSIQKLIKSIK